MRLSYKAGYARNASESANPGLWKDLVGAWVPALGRTGGELRDVLGLRTGVFTNLSASDWVRKDGTLGLKFNGVNDRIDVALPPGLISEPFSMVCYGGYAISDAVWMSVANKSSVSQQHRINMSAQKARASSFDGSKREAAGTTNVDSGGPYFVVATFVSSARREIWVNGRREGTNIESTAINGIDRLTIGTTADSTPWGWWGTEMYVVMLFNRELNGVEIRLLNKDPLAPFRQRKRRFTITSSYPDIFTINNRRNNSLILR